jgi:hypothetical protein
VLTAQMGSFFLREGEINLPFPFYATMKLEQHKKRANPFLAD